MKFEHKPVLLNEVIDALAIKPEGVYVDCTIGGAGHSKEIIKKLTNGFLYGFDRDLVAVEVSTERLKEFKNKKIFHANFKDAPKIIEESVDGILVDLGISSYQIDTAERGFSINHDGKLDMRMNREQELSAYEVVNFYSREKLIEILYNFGEENNAKRIVEKIINYRQNKPIESTKELKDIIESAFPKKIIYQKGNVSTQTFQAIRIEVNGELAGLEKFLRESAQMLKTGGRLAVISFHSLEDRIVKRVFKELATDCICPPKTPICICGHSSSVKIVTKKPITATDEELKNNRRSSSAKLRVVEKL